VVLGGGAAVGDGEAAVGGLEVLTFRQLVRCNPLVLIRVVEQVVAGGVDDLGAALDLDGQVVEIGVVVDFDGGDGLWLVLAGLGVGGEDLVARLEGGDRGGLAAGEQDPGIGGEGLAGVRERLVLLVSLGEGDGALGELVQQEGERVGGAAAAAGLAAATADGGRGGRRPQPLPSNAAAAPPETRLGGPIKFLALLRCQRFGGQEFQEVLIFGHGFPRFMIEKSYVIRTDAIVDHESPQITCAHRGNGDEIYSPPLLVIDGPNVLDAPWVRP
jgi:hypothetical protein